VTVEEPGQFLRRGKGREKVWGRCVWCGQRIAPERVTCNANCAEIERAYQAAILPAVGRRERVARGA
jgi:hypothetical protein